MMRVLGIGSDKKVFDKESAVRERQLQFSSLIDELVLVVFSLKTDKLREFKDGNLRVIPTNSESKIFYIADGYRVAKDLPSINLISAQDPFEAGLTGVFLKWKTGARFQAQAHTDFWNRYFIMSGPLNFLRFFLALFVLPNADRIRVVSQRIKNSLPGIFQKRIDVLPVFVDFSEKDAGVFDLHKKYPEFDFIILSTARLEKEKNLSLLLSSFKEALQFVPDSGLIIVGSGKEEQKLKKQAEALGIKEKVKFVGWQKDLSRYYETADLYISTSNYEGYGLSLLEAGYYGCPIVSTNVGIMDEVFISGESAAVCAVGDKMCLSRSMVELRRFKDIRHMMGASARKRAQSAVWKKDDYMKRYLKLWKNCLS